MGLFKKQFANIVEWEEYRDDILFWKWNNKEIKKDQGPMMRLCHQPWINPILCT